jgi:predicted nucleotidyltransferase
MPATRIDDPVLVRFRQELGEAYGSKLERVVLFGSRARGDAGPESDYDIAVFIHEPDSFGEEAARLATIETDILYDTGAIIDALPFHAGGYRKRTGFMAEVRRDGIDL